MTQSKLDPKPETTDSGGGPDFADRILEIDLDALAFNYRQAVSLAGPDSRVMGVIKADAYGHGLIEVARRLMAEGAGLLGVARLDEVEELRRAGMGAPVALVAGILPHQAEMAVRLQTLPLVFDLDTARALSTASVNLGRSIQALIKVDTGMTRLGFDLAGLGEALTLIRDLPGLTIRGLASHMATADEADKTAAEAQIDRFETALALAADLGYRLDLNSMANSAGLIDLPRSRFDLVRPGVMLYGSLPSQEMHNRPELRPVMTAKTRLIQIRRIDAGRAISYGGTFVSDGPMTVGAVPLGYGHGLLRSLSGRGAMLVGGRRTAILGRVCMNLTLIDLTGSPEAEVGDEVVALGRQGGAVLSGADQAEAAGTISYELFCSLGAYNPRRYLP